MKPKAGKARSGSVKSTARKKTSKRKTSAARRSRPAGLMAANEAPAPPPLDGSIRALKKLGIVVHYNGQYFYLFEDDWGAEPRRMPKNITAVAKALVDRGTVVAHTGKIAAPLGGWSTLLNLSAVIKGAEG
jgi:hypothetical protein